MKPHLIDTHCHLHFRAYESDREDVLLRIREKNMWCITVGTNAVTSRIGIAFADRHPGIFATAGYHPEHLSSSHVDEQEEADREPFDIARIRELAASSKKVVAIGETGLDFFRIDRDRDRASAIRSQENAFRSHIRLAAELDLPLVIHCRDAFSRLAEILREERHDIIRGVVHCFTGNWSDAERLLELGLHLSFTGIVTFPLNKEARFDDSIRRVARDMPIDRMLLETDAPWLAPVPHRGKKNIPTYVEFIAKAVGALRGLEIEEVARQTTANAISLFNLR